jgi:hypothetical protein
VTWLYRMSCWWLVVFVHYCSFANGPTSVQGEAAPEVYFGSVERPYTANSSNPAKHGGTCLSAGVANGPIRVANAENIHK